MADPVLPTGTVTFLFTDLEVSTRLWEQEPDAMRAALARHDVILRDAVAAHGGHVVKGTGDGVHAAFATADAAVRVAIDAQRAVGAEEWGVSEPLRVRMGLHTGVAELRDGDYFGSSVNRAARLMAVAHGGQVVCSQTTADLARESVPEGVTFADLGEHRLRDLSRPEHVFQVNAPNVTASFAPLRSLDSFPGNLPLQTSSFIGRERELARVIAALDESRVVTLTGVGGVGKTRLAYQVAAEVLPKFREGAWLVELAPVRDADGVVEAVSAVFGVTATAGLTLEASLVEFLRTKQMLMVLDNCEHVLESVGDLVELLERSCAGVVVLASSREGLSLDGERILSVPSLAIPIGDVSVDELREVDAVQLFTERAMAVDDNFALTTENAPAVVEVCRRLDGIPLAIELAAARITTMNPAELASALDRRLDVLSGSRRRAVKRQQTLRATIDWSYDLLDDDQRRLLARLSVFAGGCTREAAETVCAFEPLSSRRVFDLLAGLVSQSLVVADRDGPETRYRLLETIREYGEERAAEYDEVKLLRGRHAGYYAVFAEQFAEHVHGPDQIVWGTRLNAERDDLLAAWSWAIDTQDVDTAFRVSTCYSVFGQIGYVVVFPIDALLAVPGATEHPDYSLIVACAANHVALVDHDRDRVESLCEEALQGDAHDPRVDLRVSLARLGTALDRGDLVEAARGYERIADASRRAEIPAQAAIYLALGANVRLAVGDSTAAATMAADALALARSTRMPSAIVLALLARGASIAKADPAGARASLEESLALTTTLGLGGGGEDSAAAFLASRLHDRRATLELGGRALRHLQWMGNSSNRVIMLNLVGRALARARPDAAGLILESGRRITESGGDVTVDGDEILAFTLAAIDEALADPEFR